MDPWHIALWWAFVHAGASRPTPRVRRRAIIFLIYDNCGHIFWVTTDAKFALQLYECGVSIGWTMVPEGVGA